MTTFTPHRDAVEFFVEHRVISASSRGNTSRIALRKKIRSCFTRGDGSIALHRV